MDTNASVETRIKNSIFKTIENIKKSIEPLAPNNPDYDKTVHKKLEKTITEKQKTARKWLQQRMLARGYDKQKAYMEANQRVKNMENKVRPIYDEVYKDPSYEERKLKPSMFQVKSHNQD